MQGPDQLLPVVFDCFAVPVVHTGVSFAIPYRVLPLLPA